MQQVTFRFRRGDAEVRYLSRIPELGGLVAHAGEFWVVTEVSSDPVGVTVVCKRRRGAVRGLDRAA